MRFPELTELLAKSARANGPLPPSVLSHCRSVRNAAIAMLDAIHHDIARIGVDVSTNLSQLLIVGSLLHDILKANSAFQAMVQPRTSETERQPVRHEVLGAVMLAIGPQMAEWLAEVLPGVADRWAVIWAVAGHHLKMPDPSQSVNADLYRSDRIPRKVSLYLSHPEVKAICADVATALGVKKGCTFEDMVFDTADDEEGSLREFVRTYPATADRQWISLRDSPGFKIKLAMLKGLLIASDVAASATTEREQDPGEWVPMVLGVRLAASDLTPVILKGTRGSKPLPFQECVGASDRPVTIVVAGCGNGKTTAAYIWAQRWAAGKKLFFTYPTTGTATAGFGGYLSDQHELLSDLVHSKSEIDLEAIRGTPEDDQWDAALRIESLRVWDRKVVVCTVDTVLGLLQNQRRALYSFPAFVASAFVFDEVHSYDSRLFGGLLRFLAEFPGIPALIMSASIPPGRLKMLHAVLGDRSAGVIKGDRDLEGFRRYQINARESAEACWREVADAIIAKKKVLWVCNTVGDAIKTSRDVATLIGAKPIVYHSRFRYRDRVNRQAQVIAEFKYSGVQVTPKPRIKPGGTLVVSTQVCEMSLDISADLLVTAECPLAAFVQRLGRLNRYAEQDDPWPCLVYAWAGLPYNERPEAVDLFGDFRASMRAMRAAVREIDGHSTSQHDLATRLDQLHDREEPENYSAWLDGGWVTEPMPVRDGDKSITVVRSADVSEIETKLGRDRRRWSAGKLAPWTIPMNYRRGLAFQEQAGPYPLASDTVLEYSIEEGAEWKAQ